MSQAQKQEDDERRTREKEAARAARKQKRAERRQRHKKQSEDRHKQRQNQPDEKMGAVIQEFSSGKKEIWIMPGVTDDAKSHDLTHNTNSKSHDSTHSTDTKSHDFTRSTNKGTDVELVFDQTTAPQVRPVKTLKDILCQPFLIQVVKKMTSVFLLVHGKLFTRTG